MFSEIEQVIKALNPQTISTERKAILQPLTEFIQSKVSNQQDIRINFICTHNSRRSHLSQVWAQTLAYHFNIKNVFCYSGGTESTALFPIVAETLQNSGFQIKTISKNENSIYSIKYAYNQHPIIGFSKRLNDDFNPKSEFAAIMTCDSANEAVSYPKFRCIDKYKLTLKFGSNEEVEIHRKSNHRDTETARGWSQSVRPM